MILCKKKILKYTFISMSDFYAWIWIDKISLNNLIYIQNIFQYYQYSEICKWIDLNGTFCIHHRNIESNQCSVSANYIRFTINYREIINFPRYTIINCFYPSNFSFVVLIFCFNKQNYRQNKIKLDIKNVSERKLFDHNLFSSVLNCEC